MPEATLRPLTEDTLRDVQPWFDDPEVRRRLGDRSWPVRAIDLATTSPGTEFRGRRVVDRRVWVAFDGQTPVGLIDAEVYDRVVPYDGSRPDPVDETRAEPGPAASFALVVDPARQGRGYGRAILRALVAHPAMAPVRVFEAAAEPDNPASIRCLLAAGFAPSDAAPDWEGLLPFVLRPRALS